MGGDSLRREVVDQFGAGVAELIADADVLEHPEIATVARGDLTEAAGGELLYLPALAVVGLGTEEGMEFGVHPRSDAGVPVGRRVVAVERPAEAAIAQFFLDEALIGPVEELESQVAEPEIGLGEGFSGGARVDGSGRRSDGGAGFGPGEFVAWSGVRGEGDGQGLDGRVGLGGVGFVADLPALVVNEGDDGDREFASAALWVADTEGAGIGQVLGRFLAPQFEGQSRALFALAGERWVLCEGGRCPGKNQQQGGGSPNPEAGREALGHGLKVMRGVSPRRPEMTIPSGREEREVPQPQGESLVKVTRRGRRRFQAKAAAVRTTTARAVGVCQFIRKVQGGIAMAEDYRRAVATEQGAAFGRLRQTDAD